MRNYTRCRNKCKHTQEDSCNWWKEKQITTDNLYQDTLLLEKKEKAKNLSLLHATKRINLAQKQDLKQRAIDNKAVEAVQEEEQTKLRQQIQEDAIMRERQLQSDLKVI